MWVPRTNNDVFWEGSKKNKNNHLPVTTFTLIGSAIPNKPTQSAAGPVDEIQIGWILEKKKSLISNYIN